MPDPFAKVRPGDPVSIKAEVWNALLDIARPKLDVRSGPLVTNRDASIVRVRNDTGDDLARFDVLGLDGPIFTPSDSEDAFLREVTFKGVEPTSGHAGRFCVVLQPAPQDHVVRAYVAGVCPVRVNVVDPEWRYADVEDGSSARLVQSGVGTAQILWLEADDVYYGDDTGEMWGLVRLGVHPPGGFAVVGGSAINKHTSSAWNSGSGTVYRLSGTTPTTTGIGITLLNPSAEKNAKSGAKVQYKAVGHPPKAVIDWSDCGDLT